MNTQQIASASAPAAAAASNEAKPKGKGKAKAPKAPAAAAKNIVAITCGKASATIDIDKMALVIRGIMDESAKAVTIASAAGFHVTVTAADRQKHRVANVTAIRKAKALLSSDPSKASAKLKRIADMNRFLDAAEALGFAF